MFVDLVRVACRGAADGDIGERRGGERRVYA